MEVEVGDQVFNLGRVSNYGIAETYIPRSLDLQQAIDRYLEAARLTNRAVRCVGVSINSSSLSDAQWQVYAAEVSRRLGLPVVDPLRGGVEPLVQALLAR